MIHLTSVQFAVRARAGGRCSALVAVLLAVPLAFAETVVVGPADGSCADAVFSSIQNALDAAVPGTTVFVCAGTYREQLLITKRVVLRAAPGAALRPDHLDALTTSLRSGRPVAAAVTVRAAATIEGLAIEAGSHGLTVCDGTEPLLAGIFVRGVPVTVRGTSVAGARFVPSPPGCANGVGILVQGGGGRARIDGNTVATYQRAGIAIQGDGVRARVTENLVTGDGPDAAVPQTGIEVTNGAAATIDANVVRGHVGGPTAACELAAGIVLGAPRLRVRDNQLQSNTVGIAAGFRGHRLRDNAVDGGTVGVTGIALDADESAVRDNGVHAVAGTGIAVGGNRNRLVGNTVAAVHDGGRCDALRAVPACAAVAGRCGVGVWLTGRANAVVATTILDADVTVADDGRANAVR